MADRTVRVRLSANVNEYTSSVDRAARSTEKLHAEAEAFDGKNFGADFDANTKGAESNIDRLNAKGEKYDKSKYRAKFEADVDDTARKMQQDMEALGRQRHRLSLTEDIRKAKQEYAGLQKQMAGHTPKLDLDIRDAQRKRDQLQRSLKALEDGKVDPRIDLNIKLAEVKRNELRRKLKALAGERVTPQVGAGIKKFEAQLGLVELDLKKLRESRNKPAIEADIAGLRRDVEKANELLDRLRSKRVSPKVGLRAGELEADIARIEAELKAFDEATYQAKLDAKEEAAERKVAKLKARYEELEQKYQAKLDADSKPAERRLITLNEIANRTTRYREMRIGVNSNAATEMLSLEAIAQSLEQTRKIKIDQSEINRAKLEFFKLNEIGTYATRDRDFRVLGEFGKAKADAADLDKQLERLSRVRSVSMRGDFAKIKAEAADINRALDEAGEDREARLRLADRGVGPRIQELQRQLDQFGRTNATATVNVRGDQNVNKRMMLIMSSVALMLPAVTATAEATAGSIVSLSTVLMGGVAVAGAGFAAFKGLGDAIKAAGAYGAEPTAANLKALREQLKGTNAETQSFVMKIAEVTPALKSLQNIARAGMFPGMEKGIDGMLASLPQIANLVDKASESLGRMAQATGESLGSPDWQEYFDFLASRAVPQFEQFMRSLGRLVSGFKDLQMALDPFTQDFVDGFERMSTSFQNWAEGLEGNTSFQEWMQYIREIGPQVWDTILSIGRAIGSIAEAARPVAPVVLGALRVIADLITLVMSSDLGTPIMAAAAAFGILKVAMMAAKATGIETLFRGIVGYTAALYRGAGAAGAMSAGWAAMSGKAATAAKGTTAVGAAATGTAGKMSKLGSGLKTAAGSLPIIGTAALIAAAGMDAVGTSTSEAAESLMKGGAEAQATADNLAKMDQWTTNGASSWSGYAKDVYATTLQLLGFQSTSAEAAAEVQRMKNKLGPLGAAQLEVNQAQTKLNEVISQFGANSPQAIQAAIDLANQQKNVALQNQLVNKTGQDYLATVGRIAQESSGAGEAARHLAGGFSATELAAMGAQIRIDSAGKAVAMLPNGKTIDVRADTANTAFQLGAVQSQIKNIPPKTTVNVGVISAAAQAALADMGFKVKALPDGTVNVTAKTEAAKQQLQLFTQFGEALRVNPKIAADPKLAYDTMLKFINDANMASGKPKIEPGTAEATAAVGTMVDQWNMMEGNPKVNANTTPANIALAGFKMYADGLTPTPFVHANTDLAHGAVMQWNNDTQRLEPVPRINANSGPAWGESYTWNAKTQAFEPTPNIDANPGNATQKAQNWERTTAGYRPTPQVDANTSPATTALNNLKSIWNGARWVVNVVANKLGFAGGGPVNMAAGYADGGPVISAAQGAFVRRTPTQGGGSGRIVGPGSGTSDSINLRAARDEWVIRARVARQQGAGLMALLNAGLADITPHASRLTNAVSNLPSRVSIPSGVKVGNGTVSHTTINNYFEINNPRTERSSDDIQKAARKMANAGMFADG